MHFICEHGYVLLRDENISKDKKIRILNIIRSLEMYIWSIETTLENGKGLDSVSELQRFYKKSIECINLLKNVKTN